MWLCFNDAFVSAVADPNNKKMLKVRARKRSHLKRLFPDLKIVETEHTDYRFRVFVKRKDFAELVARKARTITYGNFKDSVADERLHDLYADFWQLHWRYQHEDDRRPDMPAQRVRA